jgi:hypothetical protein
MAARVRASELNPMAILVKKRLYRLFLLKPG